MPVYTSFEMAEDCNAAKPGGWIFLVRNFVPPLEWLAARYGGGRPAVETVLTGLRRDGVAQRVQRELLVDWRRRVLEACRWQGGRAATLDLEAFAGALPSLTVLERQTVWFAAMAYDLSDSARLMRISVETARKTWDKAGELLRGRLDTWNHTIIPDNGAILAEAASAAVPGEPVPFRSFTDLIDGRLTWQARAELEPMLASSWHEIDRLCRVREADAAVSETQPLAERDAGPWLETIGIRAPKPPFWKRLLAR